MAMIDSNAALCMTGDFKPASKDTVAFKNPAYDGTSAIIGPVTQKIVVAQSFHGVESSADGNALQKTLADLVGTFVSVDPEGDGSGDTVIADVFVKSCDPHRPKGVGGLTGGSTHLVIVDWEFILPIEFGEA